MTIQCPHCQQQIEIDDELAMLETSVECPSCGEVVQIPEQSDVSTAKLRKASKRPPWKKWKWRGGIARATGDKWITRWIAAAGFAGLTYLFYTADPRMFLNFSLLLFIWLLPIGAVVFGVQAIRKTARALRFRGAHLRLLTHPGEIGGTFKAELVIRQVLPRGTTIDGTLLNQAVNTIQHSDGKSHVAITPVFKRTHDIQIDEVPYRSGGYVIPLEYDIPSTAKDESDDKCTTTRTVAYRWRLQAKADLDGPDMDLQFSVPVFRIDDSV